MENDVIVETNQGLARAGHCRWPGPEHVRSPRQKASMTHSIYKTHRK